MFWLTLKLSAQVTRLPLIDSGPFCSLLPYLYEHTCQKKPVMCYRSPDNGTGIRIHPGFCLHPPLRGFISCPRNPSNGPSMGRCLVAGPGTYSRSPRTCFFSHVLLSTTIALFSSKVAIVAGKFIHIFTYNQSLVNIWHYILFLVRANQCNNRVFNHTLSF